MLQNNQRSVINSAWGSVLKFGILAGALTWAGHHLQKAIETLESSSFPDRAKIDPDNSYSETLVSDIETNK